MPDGPSEQYSPPITYAEVKADQISPQSKKKSNVTSPIDNDEKSLAALHEETFLVQKIMAETNRLELSERTVHAVDFGKKMILEALGKDSEEQRKLMDAIFLSPEMFQRITRTEAQGIMIPGLSAVLVKYDQADFDFVNAAKAFHELVHRWLEMQHHVFVNQFDAEKNVKTTTIETRRQGISVRKLIRDTMTGEVIGTRMVGEFLNELGNFTWQKIFIQSVFHDEKLRVEYKDEIQFREQKLREFFGESQEGSIEVDVADEKGVPHSISLDSSNLFWNRAGELDLGISVIIMQVADELNDLVGNVGRLNFVNALLGSKTLPQAQVFFRQAVDRKLGKGFYKKLRDADYNSAASILTLLRELQEIKRRRNV
jgi:hypothetical protein